MRADIEQARKPDVWADDAVRVLAGEAVDVCRGIAKWFDDNHEAMKDPQYQIGDSFQLLMERCFCVAEKWKELREKHGITAGAKI